MLLKIKKYIDSQSWKALRELGETKFVKSMYFWLFLVPLLVKLLEGISVQETINLIIFEYTLTLNPSLPFSWKAFYFSALFLATANLIIKLKCPKIIKEHLSYQSFLNEGKTKQQLIKYAEDIDFNWESFEEQLEARNASSDNGDIININDPINYFWTIFNEASLKHKKSRMLSATLLIFGFLLFMWVVIENICTVIKHIVMNIY